MFLTSVQYITFKVNTVYETVQVGFWGRKVNTECNSFEKGFKVMFWLDPLVY